MGEVRGAGNETNGGVVNGVQFTEDSFGGNPVDEVAVVQNGQDSHFYQGVFGLIREGCFVAIQKADSCSHFGQKGINVGFERQRAIKPETQVFVCVDEFQFRLVQAGDFRRGSDKWQEAIKNHAFGFLCVQTKMEVGESTLDTVETLLQGGEGSGQAGTGRIEDSIIGVKMN